MSENCRKIYPINDLPLVIPIGVQSEKGVREIGFNVRPWLDAWDGLELAVYPTRHGEIAAYPAADVELVGSVLYWRPNDTDTAIPGEGTVEIVGITQDKRKLSGACKTVCKATTLATTQDPPEGIKPYYDGIINAAEEVKRAAEDVTGVGGLYLIAGAWNEDRNAWVSNRSKAEIWAAVNAGKACFLNVSAQEYMYVGNKDGNPLFSTVHTPIGNVSASMRGLWERTAEVTNDGIISIRVSTPVKTPNPAALAIRKGDTITTYDGSGYVSVEIPESVADPGKAHQMLVSDAEGKAVWEEKLAYKTTAVTDIVKDMTLTAFQVTEGVVGMYAVTQPFEHNFVAGNTYTVMWGGTEYTSPAVDASATMGAECYVLGDAAVTGEDLDNLPFENPAPGSPYMLMYAPGGIEDGMYGQLISVGITPDPPVLSITGETTTIKRIDPEYLTPQITLTIGADGAVTSDTDFETAWAMSTAQLQAAITVKETQTTSFGHMQPAEVGVGTIRRVHATINGMQSRVLQIPIGRFVEFGDLPGLSDRTRYILWRCIDGVGNGASLWLEQSSTQSLPDMSFGIASTGTYYIRCVDGRWAYCTIDQLKADLGLT